MKKLLTLLSAATVAIGLYADDFATGTSFEGLQEGPLGISDKTGELDTESQGNFWATNGTVEATVVKDQASCVQTASGNRASQFADADYQETYLSLKTTFGNALTRNVNAGGGAQSIGDGIYFDSLVKFTAFDSCPTNYNAINFADAKIAVWVQTDENETSTNLYVMAGNLNGGSEIYDCGAFYPKYASLYGEWHRLTIKAISNIYSGDGDSVPGFVVYVDKEMCGTGKANTKGIVEANVASKYAGAFNEGALFPSMDQSGTLSTYLTSVAFDGQGDLDDIVFTETAPDFAKDDEYVTVDWNAAKNDLASITVGGVAQTIADGSCLVKFSENPSQVIIGLTYVEGKVGPASLTNDFIEADTVYYVAAAQDAAASVSVNGTKISYADITDAAAAAFASNGTPLLKLFGGTSSSDSIALGSTAAAADCIMIDLNGQEIGGIDFEKSTVCIYDSNASVTGTVHGTVRTGSGSIISNGVYEAYVEFADDTLVAGGKFKVISAEDIDIFEEYYQTPTGYKFAEVDGYIVLVEDAEPPTPVIYVAEHPWYTGPEAVVLAENLPGQTGNIVSAFHGQGAGSYLGLTYSTNPLQFDLFGVDGTNALTTIHSVATNDVTNPGFRGVAISETLGVAMTLAYATTTKMYTFPLTPLLGGNGQLEVTKPSDYAFDAAAFSPDGNYLFSNIVAGPEGNTHYVKWTVTADDNTGALALAKVGTKAAGGRGRSLAYARINGRDLVFGLVDTGKVVVMDMTDADPANWTAADLITGLPAHSYGTLCVSGVNCVDAQGNPATPHLTVATSTNNGATKIDVLNVYALTVTASDPVSASLVKSFDEDALTAAGFGDISDANRYGNTVYVTDDEATIYFARPDNKLYAAMYSPTVDISVIWLAGATGTYKVGDAEPVDVTSNTFTIEDVERGAVVQFEVVNADGVTKTATVTADSGVKFDASDYTFGWADYLGEAVNGAYEIDNLAELKLFQKGISVTTNELKLATAGETFKLTADIALDEAWPGIGVQNGKDIYSTADFNAAAFQGTFDGQNHTISGFQMVGGGLDYCGFFNSTYGATIQNLKIQYAGSLFAADTTASTLESGATFVGVAKNSTLRNLTTVAGTVSSSKGFGGIVGYLTSGTLVDSCTNNVNMTSLAKNKCGGIAMIAQGGSAVTIQNCQNNGTQTTGSSNSEYGAIVGYVGLDITIANCETTVGRFLKHQGSTVTLQGVNKGDATVLAYHGAATPGLNFAMVNGNVATFVADDALVAGNTYKVMGPSATATYAFSAEGTISFDTSLATPTYAITGDAYAITDSTSGTVTTYTAATAVAQVNSGAKYATLKEAVDAADTGDTVTVLADCVVTNGNTGITFTKGINLVNNYTITIDGANYALRIANGTTTPVTWSGTGSLVWLKGSGSPILVGSNELKASYGINSYYEGSFVLNGGTLTSTDATAKGGNLVKLEAGTFVMNDGTINGGTRGVKADSEGNNATCVLTINGGSIVNTNTAAIAASTAGSGSSTVTVNAGTFTGAIVGTGMVTIPGTSTAKFDRDQSSFCVADYKTVLSDGWYVVAAKEYYTAITLNKATTSIVSNGTETLTVTLTPASAADDSVTWTTSDAAVATVDQNGVVTAVAPGTATITAATANYSASCTVTVTEPASGYDSGDGEHTFTIPSDREAALEGSLPSGKTLASTVSDSSDLTYAQAYALGLWSENSAEVEDLDATITVGADGKVTISLANQPATGYLVTCKVYEKASLTAEWPSQPTRTYAYGSEQAFTPTSATAGFYKVEVVISNSLQ